MQQQWRKISAAYFIVWLLLFAHMPLQAAALSKANFDHDNTGFVISGAHQRVQCDSCHVRGVFKGTPSTCQGCHAAGVINATAKPGNHIKSSNTCDDCHTETKFANARMDHGSITGSCASCHNGVTATGKTPNHVRSDNQCEACHSTRAWSPARFDHASVTGTCFSCHNGVTATGKHTSHPNTPNTCEECHNTSSWGGARFDHTGITQPCSACHLKDRPPLPHTTVNTCADCHNTTSWQGARFNHNGVTQPCSTCHLKDRPPLPHTTVNTCADCHNTTTWQGARFDHSGVTQPCSTCHLSIKPPLPHPNDNDCGKCHTPGTPWTNARFDHASAAPGSCGSVGCHNNDKPNGHFNTTLSCDACHVTSGWRNSVRYSHTSPNYPTPDHRSSVTCTRCHTSNASTITWRDGAYKPDCAGCHATKYKRDSHKHYTSPTTIYYSVSELRDCSGACHQYTTTGSTTPSKTRNSKHQPNGSW